MALLLTVHREKRVTHRWPWHLYTEVLTTWHDQKAGPFHATFFSIITASSHYNLNHEATWLTKPVSGVESQMGELPGNFFPFQPDLWQYRTKYEGSMENCDLILFIFFVNEKVRVQALVSDSSRLRGNQDAENHATLIRIYSGRQVT